MNIKNMLLASAVLVSVASFAQKDELKKLKKIYDKEQPTPADLAEYKANLDKLATLATEEGDKVYYNFYKANTSSLEIGALGANPNPAQLSKLFNPKAVTDLATAYNATLEYEKKVGKKVFTDDINEDINTYKPMLVDVAVGLNAAKKYKEASEILYAVYLLDKKDQDNLYYAGYYAVNGQDYASALNYFNQLKALNYTGEKTTFWATNRATQKEEFFKTKAERDLFIAKGGTHEKPRDEKTESRKNEVYKYIAQILAQEGKVEEAKIAITEARKMDPNDTSLIMSEADLYLKAKDYDTYSKLVNEILAKEPNNVELINNLGIISSNANRVTEAEVYFNKALALDPNNFTANVQLAALKLRSDEKLVEEMNKLGNTEKDNKRYAVIKAERDKNFKIALPYLEKAVAVNPDDAAAKSTLISVYGALEMTDKAKALKAKQ